MLRSCSYLRLCLLGLLAFAPTELARAQAARSLDLSGAWEFRLDPQDRGIEEAWFSQVLEASIQLPGCLQEQGYGSIPGPGTLWWQREGPITDQSDWMAPYRSAENFKIQYFLLPDRHYIGPAWYSRNIEIPEDWTGKQLTLSLERCHWESQLWLDGKRMGREDSLGAPHRYALGELAPGVHRISLRVDNSSIVDLGEMAHSVSEETAGTWNGVVGEIKLSAHDPIHIESLRLSPKPVNGKARLSLTVAHPPAAAAEWQLVIDAAGESQGNDHDPAALRLSGRFAADSVLSRIEVEYAMGEDARLWDEFDPCLYRLRLTLSSGESFDSRELVFGLRDITVQGKLFAVNGVKTFLRGNTDCAVMPQTGYAPMDVESWRKVWRTYKAFGLNLARFHSWCPPEAAFVAADEIGIYLAPEVSEWSQVTAEDQFDFYRRESLRMFQAYGHHPSFVMMALGNEKGGDKAFFAALVELWKSTDDTRLYSIKSNAVNPPNVDYEVQRGTGPKRSIALRYQRGWPPKPENTAFYDGPPQTTIDWREATANFDRPVVQHETAQICSYPDIAGELPKFSGYLKASYLEIARDQLQQRGMWEQLPDFVRASGKWQVELTREEFEAAYRTPGLAGYHWLSLADFTGQSSAPVGFTDAFYDSKPYVDSAAVRRWIAPTVFLARLPQRVYQASETMTASIEIAHFGKFDLQLKDAVALLRAEDGQQLGRWELPPQTLGQGSPQFLGSVSAALASIKGPSKLTLEVASPANGLRSAWQLWVYPENPVAPFPENVHVSHSWDAEAQAILRQGGTLLLLPRIGSLKGDLPPCFTNHYWTSIRSHGGQSSASGVLIHPQHPAFQSFPTDDHVNWNWWDILSRCQPMILDSYDSMHAWPKDYRPLLQPIDGWKTNRKLALLAEARIGLGKLLVCSVDIESDLGNRPAARQFRASLLRYLGSPDFDPSAEVGSEAVAELFRKDAPSPETPSHEGENLPSDG